MNALTVDVEDYYHTSLLNIPIDSWNSYEHRVNSSTHRVLDCFDRHGVKGTFFIVGCVARDQPELVKEIAKRGHEIGSHSGWHRLLSQMNENSFREDVRVSKQLLEDLSGQEVYQYRAPSWSLDVSRYEWLTILEEEGYRIDSSIQPFRTGLSGSNHAPTVPFTPIVRGRKLSIIEFPSTIWKSGPIRFPFSGGFYFRALPRIVSTYMLKRVNRYQPGMLYIHPWELDPDQPRITASRWAHFIQYYQLNHTERKLNELFSRISFQPLGRLTSALIQHTALPEIHIK